MPQYTRQSSQSSEGTALAHATPRRERRRSALTHIPNVKQEVAGPDSAAHSHLAHQLHTLSARRRNQIQKESRRTNPPRTVKAPRSLVNSCTVHHPLKIADAKATRAPSQRSHAAPVVGGARAPGPPLAAPHVSALASHQIPSVSVSHTLASHPLRHPAHSPPPPSHVHGTPMSRTTSLKRCARAVHPSSTIYMSGAQAAL
mmetsp:Transcript_9919/g.26398  ORF Transcript_9919/g.26398 Transcript_9919/m.26398 type:complete len:201 (+) Transcript_9919:82-684(+)